MLLSGLDCGYTMQPEGQALDKLRDVLPDVSRIYGGPRLGPVTELADFSRAVREWADETWVAESPEERLIWDSALPFIRLDNGDYLALNLRAIETDPGVHYLNHDDESFLLSPRLRGISERMGAAVLYRARALAAERIRRRRRIPRPR